MNKELLRMVLAEVKLLQEGEVCRFTPEKAGVLRAFLSARSKSDGVSSAEQKLHRKITRVLLSWEDGSAEPTVTQPPDTPERRNQQTLRAALDKIEHAQWAELSKDDIALLRASYEVMAKRSGTAGSTKARLLNLLETAVNKIDTHLSQNGGDSSDPEDDESVFSPAPAESEADVKTQTKVKHYITPDGKFWKGSRSRVGNLQGIQTDIHATVVEYEGETLFDGDIPEHALLVIKHGGVTVQGFVAGNVVAAGDIRIAGNAQGGWVVSSDGDVSVDRVLAGTNVIAMRGDVSCEYIESPDMIFGWGSVEINQSVRGGRIRASRIQVQGEVRAAELHSCGPITADSFSVSRGSPSVICLRESLTCEDYGRPMTKSVKERRQRLHQLQTLVENEKMRDQFNENLARRCYRTALFYLLGGVGSATMAMHFQGLQAKALHLEQMLSLAGGIAEFYGSLDAEGGDFDGSAVESFKTESLNVLDSIQAEIRELPAEFGRQVTSFLLARVTSLATAIERLHRGRIHGPDQAGCVATFEEKLDGFGEELKVCQDEEEVALKKFGVSRETVDLTDRDSGALSEMLDEALQTARNGSDTSQWERVGSPLIRLLRDYAVRYKRGIQSKTADARKEIRELLEDLESESIIRYGSSKEDACCVKANRFEGDVVLTAVPGVVEGVPSNLGKAITISETITQEARFFLRKGNIQRQA